MGVRNLLLGSMVVLQLAWFAVRTRVIDAPVDAALIGLAALAATSGAVLAFAGSLRAAGAAFVARTFDSERKRLAALAFASLVIGAALAVATRRPGWDETPVFRTSRVVTVAGVSEFLHVYRRSRWLSRGHPPGVPVAFGLLMRVFGKRLLVLRLASVLLTTGTLVVAVYIVRSLLGERIAVGAGLLLLACPLFVRLGAAAMNDNAVTFFFTCSVALALAMAETRDDPTDARRAWRLALLLGVCAGAGLLSKYTAILFWPVAIAILAVHRRLVARAPQLILAGLLAGAMLGGWLWFARSIGVLELQVKWLGWGTHFATHSRSGQRYTLDAIVSKLPSAIGVYNLPVFALGLFALARRRDRDVLVIALWATLPVLPILLTIPDVRYVLPAFPAIATVMALGLDRVKDGPSRFSVFTLALVLCATVAMYFLTVPTSQRAALFGVHLP